jgi:type I restriction enzyme S subunit
VRIPFGTRFKIAPKNSILLCIEGGSAGKKIALVNQDVCFGNKLCCFNVTNVIPKYLYYYLQSSKFQSQFIKNIDGIIGGVSVSIINSIQISLPNKTIQQKIVDELDIKLTAIEKIIDKILTKINILTEYRSRIISDVVTGKIDVRNVKVPEFEYQNATEYAIILDEENDNEVN